jgi:hypothetical protein
MKSTNYKTRRYKIFSFLLSLSPFHSKIPSSASSSDASVYVLPLVYEISFTPIQNKKQEYSFAYCNIYVYLVADVKTAASRRNHEKLNSGQPVSGLRFESGNS